jgi:hypothetical protein
MKRWFTLVVLLTAGTNCSRTPTEPWDGQVRVTGSVLDFQTLGPVAGAAVVVGTAATTTNASGSYSLTVATGDLDLSLDGEWVGRVALKDRTFRGDLFAHGDGCVARYGTVVDQQTRQPVSGATVSVGSASTRTDQAGWYRLDVGCPGTRCIGFNTTFVSVTHPSYADGMFVAGRGICSVNRTDYELAHR